MTAPLSAAFTNSKAQHQAIYSVLDITVTLATLGHPQQASGA